MAAILLDKYSLGVGDRFAHQAKAQLAALRKIERLGVDVVPVWNKSHREHTTIGSAPSSVRAAADAAVAEMRWDKPYFVDADHINLKTVDGFIDSSDFYTLDVADAIGQPAKDADVEAFADHHRELIGRVTIAGLDKPYTTCREQILEIAGNYFLAIKKAGEIHRHIAHRKGTGNFVTEISMDETDSPQTPPELLVILALIADEKIPIQTIAPKFTGRFNKGVDYVGDPKEFESEFRSDLAVIAHAIDAYDLPENLKLSVHSGSDKFSIYGPMRRALAETGAGLHVKTAGTTWLEELIGLGEAGGEGLVLAKDLYTQAFANRVALCAPYAAVVDIAPSRLPAPEEVQAWTSPQFVNALRHDPSCDEFNPSLRQLLHVGYKIAAQMGNRYLEMLEACDRSISRNVTDNLFERHLKPLFWEREK